MPVTSTFNDSLPQLRKGNLELRRELQDVRDALAAATTKAETCQRAAREAWQFAQAMAKTGQREKQ